MQVCNTILLIKYWLVVMQAMGVGLLIVSTFWFYRIVVIGRFKLSKRSKPKPKPKTFTSKSR